MNSSSQAPIDTTYDTSHEQLHKQISKIQVLYGTVWLILGFQQIAHLAH